MIVNCFSQILGRKRLKMIDVHKATGISRPTLAALYYDKSKGIRFDTLNKLCIYLRVRPEEIFYFKRGESK